VVSGERTVVFVQKKSFEITQMVFEPSTIILNQCQKVCYTLEFKVDLIVRINPFRPVLGSITDYQAFHDLIIKPFDNQTVSLP
jgi:hypothetical protein